MLTLKLPAASGRISNDDNRSEKELGIQIKLIALMELE